MYLGLATRRARNGAGDSGRFSVILKPGQCARGEKMTGEEGIGGVRYDAALAAGRLICELFESNPDAGQAAMVGQVCFIVLQAIYEAEKRLSGFGVEPSAN